MTRLSAKDARAVLDAATLVKSPTWSEDRRWHVVADGVVLVVLEPAYTGGRRTGWRWWLAQHGPANNPAQPTREKAAVAGLGAWERAATSRTNREETL